MTDRDRSCHRCGASAESRVESCGFGEVRSEVCGVCGAECPEQTAGTFSGAKNPRSKRRRETRHQHEAERDLERATR